MNFIGPAMVVSVISLLANVLLIGGARQLSKDFLLVWMIWKVIAILIFWFWYGYNQLKHYNYIDWTSYGMKNCIFCSIEPESSYVGKNQKLGHIFLEIPLFITHIKIPLLI